MGIFEGLKRLISGNAEQPVASEQERPIRGTFEQSASVRPWEDRSLPPDERLKAYTDLVREKLEEIQIAFDRAGESHDVATQKEIMNSPETKKWMDEGSWLQTVSAEQFCERSYRELRDLLGKNFLGAEAWKAIGIDVGEEPPIPGAIIKPFLESDCPLHPGEKIKDTHLLVLVPKTVNGDPYSAVKLDELCATRKGSGNKLIEDNALLVGPWKKNRWASAPQPESEWILIPKSSPDPRKVPDEKHFNRKKIAAQQKVHEDYYPQYREVKVVELMTVVLLNDLVNGEPRMLEGYHFLRCVEVNDHSARVCVGVCGRDGLRVSDEYGDNAFDGISRAIAWRL